MILETELENKIIDELSSIGELSACQFIGSRQTTISDEDMITDDESVDTVIAVHTGYRSNDAFSLPTITVPVSIQITTRIEKDKSGQKHERVIEAISDKLSYWHKYSNDFTTQFTLTKMFCGELTMNGGSGRAYDKDMEIWTENITFSIRGSEKFRPKTFPFGIVRIKDNRQHYNEDYVPNMRVSEPYFECTTNYWYQITAKYEDGKYKFHWQDNRTGKAPVDFELGDPDWEIING